jgi:hypothetical protein
VPIVDFDLSFDVDEIVQVQQVERRRLGLDLDGIRAPKHPGEIIKFILVKKKQTSTQAIAAARSLSNTGVPSPAAQPIRIHIPQE